MINPRTRAYLPEEISAIKLSEIVETKNLPNFKLENKVSDIIQPVNVEANASTSIINKQILVIGGITLLAVGVYLWVKHHQNRETKNS
jgi:hypothetical protein